MIKGRFIPLLDITTVAASGKVVITPPIGYTYHLILLQHGYASGTNTAAAAMTNLSEIRVKRNNKVFQKFNGTQQRDRLLLNGTTYDVSGVAAPPVPNTAPGVTLAIPFAEMFRDSDADKVRMSLYTKSWESFTVEVDLGAASTPTLVAWAFVDDLDLAAGQPELLPIVEQLPINAAGRKFNYAYPEKRGYLASISMYQDSGGSQTATNVKFDANGETRFDCSATARLALLQANRMTPLATGRTGTITDLVFDVNGFLAHALPLPGSTGVNLTVEAGSSMSGTITAIIQRYGTDADI